MIDWKNYHSYRVFDEFIEKFIINKQSYITKHPERLDLVSGIAEIKKCFVDNYDDSKQSFDLKVRQQFQDATEEAKIIFTNIEYFWAMPSSTLTEKRKLSYALRWFSESEVNSNERFFFRGDHIVAGTGPYYSLNKFWEISALLQVLSIVIQEPKLNTALSIKLAIEKFIYNALYVSEFIDDFNIQKKCSVRNMLLHLSNPDKFECIVSYKDKEKIINVFSHVLTSEEWNFGVEGKLKAIRSKIYNDYGNHVAEPDKKERWFFYMDDILHLWKEKKKKRCIETSIRLEIEAEENAADIDSDHPIEPQPEGAPTQTSEVSLKRSSRLVKEIKKRDNYTCLACSFNYKKQIVQAHHLDPLCECEEERETQSEDLITLCPNCHYLAHHLLRLRNNDMYKGKEHLLNKLKQILEKICQT